MQLQVLPCSLLLLLAASSSCLPLSEIHPVTVTKAGKPVKVKPGIKHALPNANEHLLDPESNLVEPDAPTVALRDSLLPPPPPTLIDPSLEDEDDHASSLLLFPEREDFVTGHRIPLELFSHETRERISGGSGRYVDSSDFRRGGEVTKPSQEMQPPSTSTTTTVPSTTVSSTSTTTEEDPIREAPFILEEGLSAEDDKAYREHIHAFVDY